MPMSWLEALTGFLFIASMLAPFVGAVGVPIRLIQMLSGSILRHFARLTRFGKGVVLLSAVAAVPMLVAGFATLYEVYENTTCISNCAQGIVGVAIRAGDFGLLYILFECLLSPITYAQVTASSIAKPKP